MIIERFVLSPFQQNTRIVACERTRKAICIDPGDGSLELVEFIKTNDLDLQAVALTHGHLDHIGGTTSLVKEFPDVEIILHNDDEDLYYSLPQQPLFFGLEPHQLAALGLDYEDPPKLTRNWQDTEIYDVGELQFSIRHCPGHTLGHVVLAEESKKVVFVGDCLFAGSIGRTDLPGGSYEQLIDSINRSILSLEDDFIVYSGHGPETTVGRERTTNPFLNGSVSPSRGRFV